MSELLYFHGKYSDYGVRLKLGKYGNGALAISAVDGDGCPAFTATTCLWGEKIAADEAFIKDYAENEGVLAFLREHHIVTDIVRWVRSGYVDIPLCKIDLKHLRELA